MSISFESAVTGKTTVVQGISAGIQNVSETVSATAVLPPNQLIVDDLLSLKIISTHDGYHAVRQDVESLFNHVSNIILNGSTNFTHSLDLKQVTVDLIQDKVPESALRPTYSLLNKIFCQMTCHSFNISNAHESVLGVLEKLKSYTWDAKAVIALSAFALNFGDTWRLSLMQARNKMGNALELHVLWLAEEDKKPAQSDSSLINITLKLIEGIIILEKFFANKSYTPSNVPTLFQAPRHHIYTYWAIFSLFACANQMKPDIENTLVWNLNIILKQLTAYLNQIYLEIEQFQDLIWRIDAFRIPSGIFQLLKALIYPKDAYHFEIFAGNIMVNIEELKTKNLLLFISGLDNIDREIESLRLIYNSITSRERCQILWVPVVENWRMEALAKFERLKCLMPWHVLQYWSLIKGYRALQEVWNYQGKPIVVVVDAFGKVLNENALYPIFAWGADAFPYDPVTIQAVYQQWNWFWPRVYKIHNGIQNWVKDQDKYFFFYGGNKDWNEKFQEQLKKIKLALGGEKSYIDYFNLGSTAIETQESFWHNISHSLWSYSQNVDSSILNQIQTLLAMRNQEGWAIVSKGTEVFLFGYNDVMLKVLDNFENWRDKIADYGFDAAIKNYFFQLDKPENRPCMKLQLDNIHSPVLIPYYCPDPKCACMMEISSVTYKCCHGMH